MLDCLVRVSRSKLFCFLSNCIFRTRSASESLREIVVSGALPLFGCGLGGRFNVNDSSTWGIVSKSTVCRRRGIGIFISTSLFCGTRSSSSNSGVDVHDWGRRCRGAVLWRSNIVILALFLLGKWLLGKSIQWDDKDILRASFSFGIDRFDVDVQLRPFLSDWALSNNDQKQNHGKYFFLFRKTTFSCKIKNYRGHIIPTVF